MKILKLSQLVFKVSDMSGSQYYTKISVKAFERTAYVLILNFLK